jgi:hypothetical protein
MAKFDASSVVEPLEYDFSSIPGLADVKGIIKEPSSVQVQKYVNDSRRELERQRTELGLVDEADSDSVIAALDKMDDERTVKEQKRSAEILSALCSGHPTGGQLMKLPHRVMHVFGQWLAGEVLSPEAVTGAGKTGAASPRSSSVG